jgi:hypothetical protein
MDEVFGSFDMGGTANFVEGDLHVLDLEDNLELQFSQLSQEENQDQESLDAGSAGPSRWGEDDKLEKGRKRKQTNTGRTTQIEHFFSFVTSKFCGTNEYRSQPMGHTMVGKLMHHICKDAGIEDRTNQILRHSACTDLNNAGVSVSDCFLKRFAYFRTFLETLCRDFLKRGSFFFTGS